MLGRKQIVDALVSSAVAGRTVLIFGPLGIGKTSILREVERIVRETECPIAYCPKTTSISDVTAALAATYPEVGGRDRRALRSALRMAVAARPGLLLLDHLQRAGTMLKSFVRSLRGTGLGTILAADTEHERDHERVRALRLAYEEVRVPPLGRRELTALLQESLGDSWPRLNKDDRDALLGVAAGRPGWIRMLADCLAEPSAWAGGRIRIESLRARVQQAVAARYLDA